MQRRERVVEHVIAHAPAQSDTLGLVELPVDAEIDSALAVLFFSRGKRREATGDEGAHVSVVAPGNAVKFVRNKREGDIVSPVEPAQGLEQSAPEAGVT